MIVIKLVHAVSHAVFLSASTCFQLQCFVCKFLAMLPKLYINYLTTESVKIKLILCWAVISISAPKLKGGAVVLFSQ